MGPAVAEPHSPPPLPHSGTHFCLVLAWGNRYSPGLKAQRLCPDFPAGTEKSLAEEATSVRFRGSSHSVQTVQGQHSPCFPHSGTPFPALGSGNSRLWSCQCSRLVPLITGGDGDWAGQMLFWVRSLTLMESPLLLNAAESVLILLEKKSQVYLC